ncbi:hypothetical protein scyTo_0011910 [Scyliorhinus torazame]|uniref:RING-type domain-containing protein n=1 Tax=Scyliorhinus torazame TaxID=75743 RepID=A0A401NY31_SCYTO|nr:hypothetical protein [Scyliorhinus torazame]
MRETDPEYDHCAVCIEGYKSKDVVRILPCKHVFHKQCVDPWLNEHCTCPICKLNILKALGLLIGPDMHCTENSMFDMEQSVRGSPANQRSMPIDVTNDGSISLEPLRFLGSSQLGQEEDSVPRSREMNVTVTKEWLIIASFGVLSALTLFYMIIKATTGTEAEDMIAILDMKMKPHSGERLEMKEDNYTGLCVVESNPAVATEHLDMPFYY